MMTERQRRLQDEAPTPLSGFFTLLATVTAIGFAVLVSPAGGYATSEANATAAEAPNHEALFRGGYAGAPLEADASVLPPTF